MSAREQILARVRMEDPPPRHGASFSTAVLTVAWVAAFAYCGYEFGRAATLFDSALRICVGK